MHVITYYSWLSLPFLCFRLWAVTYLLFMLFSCQKGTGGLRGISNDTQLSHVCWLSLNRWQRNTLMCGTPSQKAHRDMERQIGVRVGEMEERTKEGWCWQLAYHHLHWFTPLRPGQRTCWDKSTVTVVQSQWDIVKKPYSCKRCLILAPLVCFMASGGKALQLGY